MTGLYNEAYVAAVQAGLNTVVSEWGLGPDTRLSLMNLSENATFLATDPRRANPVVFRVQRPGYHTLTEVSSELDWVADLHARAIVRTPALVPRIDGSRIGGFAQPDGPRRVVAFEFMTGDEPDPAGDLVPGFRELGAISARLHGHAAQWHEPSEFQRKTWDWDAAFGAEPLWGDWRAALGLTSQGRAVLEDLATDLRGRCVAYGTGQDRFGLIHADLRLANLLQDGNRLGVIDFDDCGFSWHMYDFAAAISFIETDPKVPELAQAWIEGYRCVRPLSTDHVAMIPTMVMFRRLLLTAWIATHAETETAAWAGHASYTQGTIDMARRFLADDQSLLPGL